MTRTAAVARTFALIVGLGCTGDMTTGPQPELATGADVPAPAVLPPISAISSASSAPAGTLRAPNAPSFSVTPDIQVIALRTPTETRKTITFENGLNNVTLPIALAGASFRDWYTAIDTEAGGTGNFANETSPSTVGFWFLSEECQVRSAKNPRTGRLTDKCATERTIGLGYSGISVSLYYASAVPVAMEAYSTAGVLLASVAGRTNIGLGPPGPPDFGAYNLFEPLTINLPNDTIAYVILRGYVNATAMDEFSILRRNGIPVPVPGTYTVPEGGTVSFDGSASYDPDGEPIASYLWDFGGGITFAGVATARVYPASGSFPVSLTVTDLNGVVRTATTTVTVSNVAPTATFVAPQQVAASAPFQLAFTDPLDPSAADLAALQYAFDCGLGFGPFSPAATAACVAPAASGTIPVAGRVRDPDGAMTTYTAVILRPNTPPVAVVPASYTVPEGGTVTFDGTASTDPDGDPLTYLWDFGGGVTAAGPTVSRVYPNSGSYVVKLTVSDGKGTSHTAQTAVTVTNVAPTAGFVVPGGAVPASAVFTLSFVNPFDPSPVDAAALLYAFDCGLGFGPLSASMSVQCTAPATAATLAVKGRIQDPDGGASIYTATVTVLAPPPPPPPPPPPQPTLLLATIDILPACASNRIRLGDDDSNRNVNDDRRGGNSRESNGRENRGNHQYNNQSSGCHDDDDDHCDDHGDDDERGNRRGGSRSGAGRDDDDDDDSESSCGDGATHSIPVGILSIAGASLTDIDPATLTLGDGIGADVPISRTGGQIRFRNYRGVLTAFFSLRELVATGEIKVTTTSLTLRGRLRNGTRFIGTDVVKVVLED